MPLIARLGDTSTHGGEIITAAQDVYCEGARVARKGDILNCAIHGPQPIVEHSDKNWAEGQPVARHGDAAACGALLISGAVKTYDEAL